MRVLLAFRIALAVSVLVYFAFLGAGVGGLISGEVALVGGLLAGSMIIATALCCVVAQLILFISHKRHSVHG